MAQPIGQPKQLGDVGYKMYLSHTVKHYILAAS